MFTALRRPAPGLPLLGHRKQQMGPRRRPRALSCREGAAVLQQLEAVPYLTVRRAELADVEALVTIEDGSRPGGHWMRDSIQDEVTRERATVLLAEREWQAVGLLVAWAVPPDELHIMELAVLPEHRRQGVARQLMQHAIELHRPATQLVLLEVRRSNEGAQALYRKLGFEAVGTRRRYYSDGEDAVLMNLSLAQQPGGAAAEDQGPC